MAYTNGENSFIRDYIWLGPLLWSTVSSILKKLIYRDSFQISPIMSLKHSKEDSRQL